MASTRKKPARPRFKVGDRVRIKEFPTIFYTRTQVYVRGAVGEVTQCTYADYIPEDEAWDKFDGDKQQYYIVKFKQKDLWPEYPFEIDTLQTEFYDRWLEPA